ncbi:MAG: hypothetical protein ACJ749_16850 [Flavisolibacter sp.]
MRRLIFNKWFLLSVVLVVGLAAFSYSTYRDTRSVCSFSKEQDNKHETSSRKGELTWDAISTQFSSISVH